MQALDLAAHRPEEYQGKLVVWNEVEYEVGPCAGSGRSRIVHTLINRRSRLCLHVLKIRRLSLQGEAPRKVQPAVIPLSIEVDLPGGKAEVQAHVGPREGCDDPAVLERLAKADAHLRAQEWTEAFQGYREVLQVNPSHTEALLHLAGAMATMGDADAARDTALRAREIEPNYVPYQRACIRSWAATGFFRVALGEYEAARKRFPKLHDLDDLGAGLNMECGYAEKAVHCALECTLVDEDKKRLIAEVKSAFAARQKAQPLVQRARARPEESIGLLQQAYEIDSHDPLLAMNLAFALARANKHSEARQLLVGVWRIVPMHFSETCLANAAFCAIRAKDLRAGMALLDGLAHTLLKRYDPEKDSLAFILPGVGVWAGENQVQEKTLSSAAEIVTEGVREYAKQTSVPETVLALARLYAQGAAETGR